MRKLPPDLVERYVSHGWWSGETIGQLLTGGWKSTPQAAFEVHSEVRPYAGTIGDVELLARRLAAGLRERGVGPGDVVVFQLPNWMEAAATFWASALLGAVVVPVVHFYGPKELRHILAATKPKVVIAAAQFGRQRHDPSHYADVPIVGVVGVDFDELLADEPQHELLDADPSAPTLIAFTSGTTSDPKGVIHSHQTLACETRQLAALYPEDGHPLITGAPVGHFIGMLSAFLLPVVKGLPIHLLDVWNPARVIELMDTRGLKIGGGAPYFVTSVLDHPDFTEAHVQFMRYAGMGGSTVPDAVTRRLSALGITAYRSYGSTEHPSISGSSPSADAHTREHTDGLPLDGVEIRLSPDGEIWSRGPDLCLGYTDDALDAKAFDDEGWYRTGDVGVLDDEGRLTITDRKNDIIIRGGENISAQEIEDVLLSLAGIAEVAVVAAPDQRLGEHAAAVVRVLPGAELPTLEDVRAHLDAAGLAKQKWPEELHQVQDFPRTASGKVQKVFVRRLVAEIAARQELSS